LADYLVANAQNGSIAAVRQVNVGMTVDVNRLILSHPVGMVVMKRGQLCCAKCLC
jgi:hypothetical protein